MPSSSSIFDPFVISALPRLPTNDEPAKICTIPNISTSNQDSQSFDIGISGSYIGTFITYPTPKLIWSYALSPLTVVECLDSYILKKDDSYQDGENGEDLKIFAVGLTERKKNYLRFISYGNHKNSNNILSNKKKVNGSALTNTDSNDGDSVVTNEEDRATSNSELLKEVSSFNITVKSKIVNIKFINKGLNVAVLLEDGSIEIHKVRLSDDEENKEDKEEEPLTFFKSTIKNRNSIVFNRFINPFELNIKQIDSILLLVTKNKTTSNTNATPTKSKKDIKPVEKYTVKLISLEKKQALEISNSILDLPIEDSTNNFSTNYSQFSYDSSGKLIYLDANNLKISVFSLPYIKQTKEICIASLFTKEKEANSLVSVLPSSSNRLLISKGSTLCLVDILNEAVLGSLDLYPKSKLPINESQIKKYKEVTLLQSPIVKGTSLKTKKSFLIYMLKNPNDNFALLNYVSIDVGLGKLSDLLGKGIPKQTESLQEQREFRGIPSLVYKNQFKSISSESSILINHSNSLSTELNEFYNKLVNYKQINDISSLESELINYLKNREDDDEQVVEPTKEKSKDETEFDESFKVFELDKDRVVDSKFIKKSIELLFGFEENTIQTESSDNESNSNKSKILKVLPEDGEIPERALTYLLTHPLFPSEYCEGLLDKFQNHPRLMRQAIVTCPNLPCHDLVKQLSSTDNEEIFKDLITRLIEEFSTEKITAETIKLVKSETLNDQISVVSKFQLDKVIEKILKLNFGFEILNSIIDSNGLVLSLHYSKNEKELEKLINRSQLKLDSLNSDAQLLTIVNQSLIQHDLQKESNNNSVINSHHHHSGNGIINKESNITNASSIKETKSKIDDIIQIASSFSVSSTASSSTSKSDSKKVPVYSIERLVI